MLLLQRVSIACSGFMVPIVIATVSNERRYFWQELKWIVTNVCGPETITSTSWMRKETGPVLLAECERRLWVASIVHSSLLARVAVAWNSRPYSRLLTLTEKKPSARWTINRACAGARAKSCTFSSPGHDYCLQAQVRGSSCDGGLSSVLQGRLDFYYGRKHGLNGPRSRSAGRASGPKIKERR